MASRSLNKVQLIGNLTKDPELKYTPNGNAVCVFGLATNRSWTTDAGEKREEADFHRIVAWNKLAEICSQYLSKGRRIYAEGRLSNRSWVAQDGQQRSITEIVIDDMIMLDSRAAGGGVGMPQTGAPAQPRQQPVRNEGQDTDSVSEQESARTEVAVKDEVAPDDIPF